MDTKNKLLLRLEAINSESSELEALLLANRNETKEIESAIRVINKYSGEEIDKSILESTSILQNTPNISDAILESITEAAEVGTTPNEMKKYMKEKYNMDVKSSTLSVTIQRHKTNKKNIAKVGNRWFLASLVPQSELETKETPALVAPGNIQ